VSKHQHFILNKPYGYLSQFITNQKVRRNKKMLGELHSFPAGTMAIGRLDESTEGLLLLTTNGKVSRLITGRSIEKEYYVQVDGMVTEEAIKKLQNGVDITVGKETYQTLPGKAFIINPTPKFHPRAKPIRDERHGPTSWISITITEGKNRQVRKMTASVGFPTLRLVRVRIGNVKLDDLEPGAVIEVTEFSLD